MISHTSSGRLLWPVLIVCVGTCVDRGKAQTSQNCPPGSFSTAGMSGATTLCELCHPGLFSINYTEATECTACPHGFSSPRGASSADMCTPIIFGRCGGNTDASNDIRCSPGTRLSHNAGNITGSDETTCCESCPIGSYGAGTALRAHDPCVLPLDVSAGDVVGLSGGYGPNQNCAWRISCASGFVELSFVSFHTQGDYDFVNIYDGPTSHYPVLASLHGDDVPPIQVSSTSSMFVQLVSDNSDEHDGFSAIVSCPGGASRGDCATCEAGHVDHDSYPASPCQACPAGRFANASGTTECSSCAAGHTTLSSGARDVSLCIVNTTGMCAGNADGSTDLRCPPGSALIANASDTVGLSVDACCEVCSAGTFSTGTTTEGSACESTMRVTHGDVVGERSTNDVGACRWQIVCDSGPVVLTFESSLADMSSPDDVLSLYDGSSTAAPVLSVLQGHDVPSSQTSTGSSMFVELWTSGGASGWNFPGTVHCPGGPYHAPCDACALGQYDHDADSSTECVPCPEDTYGNRTGQIGCYTCPTGLHTATVGATSSSECVGICSTFDCDVGSTPRTGAAHIRGNETSMCCEDCPVGTYLMPTVSQGADACVGVAAATAGDTIDSSGGYGRNQVCSWRVACAFGPATISFSSFATEADWDFVHLYDGADALAPALSTLHGSEIPPDQSSSGPAMYIELVTDGSVQADGFTATVTCDGDPQYPECEPCPTGFHDHDSDVSTVCHPCAVGSYANETGTGANCTACPEGWLSLQPATSSADCSIRDCRDGTFSLALANAGPEDHDCGGVSHVTDGDTLGTAGGYGSNHFCSWRVACASGPATISFSSFATEADWDFVHLYDGADALAPALSTLHGSEIPPDQSSSGPAMYIELVTDGSVHDAGFVATVTCPGGGLADGCEPCAPGQFDHDGDASTHCLPCPDGTFSEQAESTSCSSCPADFTSHVGSSSSHDCFPIIDGMCAGNTYATDVVCSPGTVARPDGMLVAVNNDTDAVQQCCEQCPAGTFSPGGSQAGIDPCEGEPLHVTHEETFSPTQSDIHLPRRTCAWVLACDTGHVELSLAINSWYIDAEIHIYDGADAASPILTSMGGWMQAPGVMSSGTSMFFQLIQSGESHWDNFIGTVTCAGGPEIARCQSCAPGHVDHDADAATRCEECPKDTFYDGVRSVGNANSTECTSCPANYTAPAGSATICSCTAVVEGMCFGNTDPTEDVTCASSGFALVADAEGTVGSSEDECCEACLTGKYYDRGLENEAVDPCTGGNSPALDLTGGAHIHAAAFDMNQMCKWRVRCDNGAAVISFNSFDLGESERLIIGPRSHDWHALRNGRVLVGGAELPADVSLGTGDMYVFLLADEIVNVDAKLNASIYCPGGDVHPTCRDCPAGRNDHDLDPVTACQECPSGTYSEAAASSCLACPDSTSSLPGATSSAECNLGTCPPGTFSQLAFGNLLDPCDEPVLRSGNLGSNVIDFTGRYADDLTCRWLVTCGNGTAPTITADAMNTESGWDWVNIFDGGSAEASRIARLSGGLSQWPTEGYTSSGSSLFVQFTSDGSVRRDGFRATVSCEVNPNYCSDCSPGRFDHDDDFRTPCVLCPTGSFSDTSAATSCTSCPENFTTPSPGQASCTRLIQGFCAGNTHWEQDVICPEGFVLRDNASDVLGTTVSACCDECPSGSFSPGSLYGALDDPCAGVKHVTHGQVIELLDYGNSLACRWQAVCAAGSVGLSFEAFSVEDGYDHVLLFDGDDTSGPLMASLDGSGSAIQSLSFESTTTAMLVYFTSDDDGTDSGFTARVTCSRGALHEACSDCTPGRYDHDRHPSSACLPCPGGMFSDDAGAVSCIPCAPGFSSAAGSSECTEIAAGLCFGNLDSTQNVQCPVGTHPTRGDEQVAAAAPNASDVSSCCSVCPANSESFVPGRSDDDPCVGTRYVSDGDTVRKDGVYGNHNNCQWLAICDSGPVVLSFSEFATELGYDYIRVWDGDGMHSPLIAVLSGLYVPGDVQSTGESMYINFVSDQSQRSGWHEGFVATVSCPSGSVQPVCNDCPQGKNDLDGNAATPCEACPAGKYDSRAPMYTSLSSLRCFEFGLSPTSIQALPNNESNRSSADHSLSAGVLYRRWDGITGSTVSEMLSSTNYGDPATIDEVFTELFEAPTNVCEICGTEMEAYFRPSESGAHTFRIAADDNAALWFGVTRAEAVASTPIATVPGWTSPRQWDKYGEQVADPVNLVANQTYYLRAIANEDAMGDNLAVGVTTPSVQMWPIQVVGERSGDGAGANWTYLYVDSDCNNRYEWIDIETVGTAIQHEQFENPLLNSAAGAADDGFFELSLQFTFPFFGQNFTLVHICTNGYLTFGQGAYASGANLPVPTPGGPLGGRLTQATIDALIAVFWMDLNPSVAGTIYYYDSGSSLTVSWVEVGYHTDPGHSDDDLRNTFQITLLSSGDMIMQYRTIQPGGWNSGPSIGFESGDGTQGEQLALGWDTAPTDEGSFIVSYQQPSHFSEPECSDCPSGLLSAEGAMSISDCNIISCGPGYFAWKTTQTQDPCGDAVPIFTGGDSVEKMNYGNDEICEWLITCTDESQPSIVFITFELENDWDFVHVHDGPDPFDPFSSGITSFTGRLGFELPVDLTYTASSSSMILRMTTDISITAAGFRALVTCSNGGDVEPCAACEPGRYDHDGLITGGHTTQCQECDAARYSDSWAASNCDDCPEGTASRPGAADVADCSLPACPDGTTSLDIMTGTGGACVGTSHVTDGAAIGTTDGYGRNQVCSWRVACASGPATISFSSFATEADWDFVYVYDGADALAPALSTLHGSEIPPDQTSSGPAMYIELVTDGSVHDAGFVATVTCPGGGLADGCEPCAPGQFDHDGDASTACAVCPSNTYSAATAATDCTPCPNETFAPVGSGSVDACVLPTSYFCVGNNDPSMDVTCPVGTSLASNAANTSLHTEECCESCPAGSYSPGSVLSGGDPCSGGVHVTHGHVMHIQDAYPTELDCGWRVTCAAGPVEVSFLEFGTEVGWDFVYIYEGSSASSASNRIETLTGPNVPTGIVSEGPDMFVQFTSDYSISSTGFTAVAVCAGGSASPDCVSCSSGQYDHDDDATTPCLRCPAGQMTVAPLAASGCTACSAGTYAPAGSSSCESCYVGQYDHDASDETASWVQTWSDSTYVWVDIQSTGILIDSASWVHDTNSWAANDGYVIQEIHFHFPYFGQVHDSVHIGTNGYLTFGAAHYALGRALPIPTPGGVLGSGTHAREVDGIVAIFWADLDPSSGGTVSYSVTEAESMVVSYDSIPYCCGAAVPASTFQAVLHSSGDIQMNYQQLQPGGTEVPSIGFENHDGTLGEQIAYGWAALPGAETAFRIYRSRVPSPISRCQQCPAGQLTAEEAQTSCTACPAGSQRSPLVLPLEVGVASIGSSDVVVHYNNTYQEPLIILGIPTRNDATAAVVRIRRGPRRWCGSVNAGQCSNSQLDWSPPPCVWNVGYGHGVSQFGWRHSVLGDDVATREDCEALVHLQEPAANGISFSESGECVAQFEMNGHDNEPGWETCAIVRNSCENVAIDAEEGCTEPAEPGVFVAYIHNYDGCYVNHNRVSGPGHGEETVAWMIIQEGVSEGLQSGHVLSKCAGTGSLCTRLDGDKTAAQDWVPVQYELPLAAPVVISQVQTHADSEITWTRHRELSEDEFQIRVEGLGGTQEALGWVAFSTDAGDIGGLTYSAMTAGATSQARELEFRAGFVDEPGLFGGISSFHSADIVVLRTHGSAGTQSATIMLQEEDCTDSELIHNEEVLSVLSISPGVAVDVTVQTPTCTQCPAGQVDHDASATSDCVQCEAGRYNDEVGAIGAESCVSCPLGKTSVPGSASVDGCYQILVGRCSGNLDSTTDVLCPSGSELKASAANISGTTDTACCDQCPAGRTSVAAVDPCSSTALLSSGDIVSVSGGYSANANCNWRLRCATGPVQLTFTRFLTESFVDVVELYDGTNVTASALIGSISGSSIPPPVVTQNFSIMSVRFTSDSLNQNIGFMAVAECPEDDERIAQCEMCAVGQFDHDSDASTPCEFCVPGRYSDSEALEACFDCPAGFTTLASGMTSADNCSTDCKLGIEIPGAVLELDFNARSTADTSGANQPCFVSSGSPRYVDGHGTGYALHFDGDTTLRLGQVTGCDWHPGAGQGRFYRSSLAGTGFYSYDLDTRRQECIALVQAQCPSCDGALLETHEFESVYCYSTSGYEDPGPQDAEVESCQFSTATAEFNGINLRTPVTQAAWVYVDDGAYADMVVMEKGTGSSDWLMTLRVPGESSDFTDPFQISFAGTNAGRGSVDAGLWCIHVDMGIRGSTATDVTLRLCDDSDDRQFFTYNPNTLTLKTAQDTSVYAADLCLKYFHTASDPICEPLTLAHCDAADEAQKFEIQSVISNNAQVYQWRNRQRSTEVNADLSIRLHDMNTVVGQYVWACPADGSGAVRWQMRTAAVAAEHPISPSSWQLAISSQADDETFYYDSTAWTASAPFVLENGNAKTSAYTSVLVEKVRITMNNVSGTWNLPAHDSGRFTLRDLVLRSPEDAVYTEPVNFSTPTESEASSIVGTETNVWSIPERTRDTIVCFDLAFNGDTSYGDSARARIGFALDDDNPCDRFLTVEGVGLRNDPARTDLGSGHHSRSGDRFFYPTTVEVYGRVEPLRAEASYQADLVSSQLDPVHSEDAAGADIRKASWVHVAMVWDGTHRTRYVDGTLVGRDQPDWTVSGAGTAPIHIGGRPDSSVFGFIGSMDSMRLFDRALTAEQVAVLAAEHEILAPCVCPVGSICDDGSDMTMSDVCSATGECAGVASFGSSLTYPGAPTEIPDVDSHERQELEAGIIGSLVAVMSAVGVDVSAANVRVSAISVRSAAGGRRLQSDAQLVVEFLITAPLAQVSPELRDAMVSTMEDPGMAGLPLDTMALNVSGQVLSGAAVAPLASVTWAKEYVACTELCGMAAYDVQDEYICEQDGLHVEAALCVGLIGEAPVSVTICRETAPCRCTVDVNRAIGYSLPSLGDQGMPDLGLPDLGMPPLPGSAADLVATTCDTAQNYVGTPAVDCPATGTEPNVYDTIVTGRTYPGICQHGGAILGPNDIIYIMQGGDQNDNIAMFDTTTETFDRETMNGLPNQGLMAYSVPVLAPNGFIYGFPMTAHNVIEINTVRNTYDIESMVLQVTQTNGLKFGGGALAPNGWIYGFPFDANTVCKVNPLATVVNEIEVPELASHGSWKYLSPVLTPQGKFYNAPMSAPHMMIWDPATDSYDIHTFSTSTSVVFSGPVKWSGAALAPTGKIYAFPMDSEVVLVVDPATDTLTTIHGIDDHSNRGMFVAGGWKFGQPTVGINGVLYAPPVNGDSLLIVNPYDVVPTFTVQHLDDLFPPRLDGTSLWDHNMKWLQFVSVPNGKLYAFPWTGSIGTVLVIQVGMAPDINISGCVLGCAPGTYDADANPATPCLTCPPGSTTDTLHLPGAQACTQCAAGRYDEDADSTTACIECNPGTASELSGSTEPCQACIAGDYATAGATVCVPCPAGEADLDSDPGTPCDACTAGTVSDAGDIVCTECSTGFADTDNDPGTPCAECSPGSYATVGEVSCHECAVGFADLDGHSDTPCEECPPGTFAAAAAIQCTPCPVGYADDDASATTPCSVLNATGCSAGNYIQPDTGACTACIAGQADTDGDPLTICETCEVGHASSSGATSCTACAMGEADHDEDPATPCVVCLGGTFSHEAAVACTACVSGRADTDGNPSTSCVHCNSGDYSEAGATACVPCIAGTADLDSDPSTACVACESGRFAPTGQSNCAECPTGKADTDSDPATDCDACATGTYASAATTVCQPCRAGTADEDSQPATECAQCNPGTYAAEGSIMCFPCNAGQYDHDTDPSTACHLCDVGTHGNASGSTVPCAPCEAGRADEDSDPSTDCAVCAQGKYAHIGDTVCAPCEAGYVDHDFSPSTPCDLCPYGTYNNDTSRAGECDSCPAGTFRNSRGGAGIDDCEACREGQYSDAGADVCVSCDAGWADEDMDASTPCTACPNGTYAGCGATECVRCMEGHEDADDDPSTPCTPCAPGMHWYSGLEPEGCEGFECLVNLDPPTPARCTTCPAGKADTDRSSTTTCHQCRIGTYAAMGSTSCTECADSGLEDDDSDPSTACATAGSCHQDCPIGWEDRDCSESSPCTECAEGRYSAGGRRTSVAEEVCVTCPPGNWAPRASLPTECTGCSLGQADSDSNPWTACTVCPNGTTSLNAEIFDGEGFQPDQNNDWQTNATECRPCAPGTVDSDLDASTLCTDCDVGSFAPTGTTECLSCEPGRADLDLDPRTECDVCPAGRFSEGEGSTECTSCQPGRYNGNSGSNSSFACSPCPAGHWTFVNGTNQCSPCQQGSYRTGLDENEGCKPCNDEEYKCDATGLEVPMAAPGFYVIEDIEYVKQHLETAFSACTPATACTGSCKHIDNFVWPDGKTASSSEYGLESFVSDDDDAPPDYSICPGAMGTELCRSGYEGDRCALCTQYDPEWECISGDPEKAINGYYRIDNRCEPCPCSIFGFWSLLIFVIAMLVIALFLLDSIMKRVNHISTIVAPVSIFITFGQTTSVLLDLDVPWPALLRDILKALNIFNLNIQMLRPECTMPFGLYARLGFTLLMPLALVLVLGIYMAIQFSIARHESIAKFRAEHEGKSAQQYLTEQALLVLASVFVFCSIFFLRNVLQVFNCESDPTTGLQYLRAEPNTECQLGHNDDKYISMYIFGWIGILEYATMLVLVAYGLRSNKDMFGFLGDKFEDEWYYWEMVIVSRKVFLMISFLFFSAKVEQAWFFGSFVIITALVLHSFARPFEDDLIDICELFSLVSLLFIQQSALVYTVVDDPVDPDTSDGGRMLSKGLKWMSVILILANCMLATIVEVRVWQHVQDSEEDYKVKMTKKKMKELNAELKSLETTLEIAERNAAAWDKRKAAVEQLKAASKAGKSLRHFGSLSSLSSMNTEEAVGKEPTSLDLNDAKTKGTNDNATETFDNPLDTSHDSSDEGEEAVGKEPTSLDLDDAKTKGTNDNATATFDNPLDTSHDASDEGEGESKC